MLSLKVVSLTPHLLLPRLFHLLQACGQVRLYSTVVGGAYDTVLGVCNKVAGVCDSVAGTGGKVTGACGMVAG